MTQHSEGDQTRSAGKGRSSANAKAANEMDVSKRVFPTKNQVAYFAVVPQLLWFLLAVVALSLFARPVLKLLNEGRISKVAVGVFELDLAQQAVANIKEGEGIPKTAAEFKPIADRAKAIANKLDGAFILWVDDKNPSQNVQERRALKNFGIQFDLASSSDEALKWLDRAHYDAIISNINRPSEETNNTPCFSNPLPAGAGCVFAKVAHDRYGEDTPPIIFYSARYPLSSGTPPHAFAVTNRVDKLFQFVFDTLERRTIDEPSQ